MIPTRTRRAVNRRARQNKTPVIRNITDITSYSGSKVYTFRIPANPVKLTTTVTTGVIAYEGQVSPPTVIGGFTTRFGTLFDEYRVIKATIELHPIGLNVGETALFLSEIGLGTPTNLEAEQRPGILLNNNNQLFTLQNNTLSWRATDLLDLQFQNITVGYNGVHYYVYTDNANYGAPTAVTDLWIVRPFLTIEFRGIRST